MKGATTLFLSLLLIVTGFAQVSQELQFDVRGSYVKPIKLDQLHNAITINDIKDNYPSSWITNYEKVEIKTSLNGINLAAQSMSDTLSAKQKQILSLADIGTDIVIAIHHNYSNPVTGVLEPREVHFSFTVVPEVEAEYSGGQEKLSSFLMEAAIKKMPDDIGQNFEQAIISFTVNESGTIDNAYVEKSSGDPSIDKMLLSAINQMPTWQPAENATGVKVKQKFQFTVGYPNC